MAPENEQRRSDGSRTMDIGIAVNSRPIEISIVMPCLNEADTLAICIAKARKALTDSNTIGEIIVADNGPGIDAGFLPHVFEHFSQQDGTTTRRHGGLGLGLAIVRHVAQLHGGSVHAENISEAGGALFVLTLPLTPMVSCDPRVAVSEAR